MNRVLLDTGPLVAYLNGRDAHHAWARDVMDSLRPPLLTCEAVLSEACFLVRNLRGGPAAVLQFLERGIVRVDFRLDDELPAVRRLIDRYANVPMSLADACLVRMTELEHRTEVFTVDRDFTIFRRDRRKVIPVLLPPE